VSKVVTAYKFLFTLVFTLYVYLGKGIAYGYFAELLLISGILLIIKERRNIQLIKGKSGLILYVFLIINFLYIFRGIMQYGFLDTIRDSFMFNYIFFAFILLLFYNDLAIFFRNLLTIYKYYPIVLFILYLISFNDFLGSISVFGDIHLLFFKFGDISVHLFAAFIFQIAGLNGFKRPYDILNLVLIFLLFSVASSYSRGGMLSFLIGFFVFYRFMKSVELKQKLRQYLKYFPVLLVVSYLFLTQFKVSENFQGRTVGVEQVTTNFTSIFSLSEEGGLNDNKLWRILWWGQIIDYTFNGPYFVFGKGLGVNLAEDDQILTTDLEGELRSPHNFNLTILARFGVFIFFLWIIWIFTQLKRVRRVSISNLQLVLIVLQIAFLFNASFDVFLEGPMGAFPFWVFVGLDLIFDNFKLYGSEIEVAIFNQEKKLLNDNG